MLIIGICDDIARERIILKTKIEEFLDFRNIQYKIFTYKTGTELLRDGIFLTFDIIFLDIKMPGINGIELGIRIRDENKIVKIIYVTGYEENVYKALNDVHCFLFWIKPLDKETFDKNFGLVLDYMRVEQNKIKIMVDKTYRYFSPKEIYYFKCMDGGSSIILPNKKFRTYYSLNELEGICNSKDFARPNRSYLVSLENVQMVGEDTVLMVNQEKIELSRRKKRDFKDRYGDYLQHYIQKMK